MDNVVTTKCKGCVFAKEGCKLNKLIFGDGDSQFTDGFCRFKRLNIWNEQFKVARLEEKIEVAVDEECRITCLITCLEFNIEKLNETLDSIVQNGNSFIKEFVILTFSHNPKQLHKILALIKEKKRNGISWRLENLNHEDQVDPFFSMDWGIEFVTKSKWFFNLQAGEHVSLTTIELIKNILSFKHNNIIAFYFDKENHIKIITNIYAFQELRGNLETPFLWKLKTFENFETVCMKIEG